MPSNHPSQTTSGPKPIRHDSAASMLEAEENGLMKQPLPDPMPQQLRLPAAKGSVDPTHHRRRVIMLKPLDDPGTAFAAGNPADGITTPAVLAQPPALGPKVQPGLEPAPAAASAGSPTSVLERGLSPPTHRRPPTPAMPVPAGQQHRPTPAHLLGSWAERQVWHKLPQPAAGSQWGAAPLSAGLPVKSSTQLALPSTRVRSQAAARLAPGQRTPRHEAHLAWAWPRHAPPGAKPEAKAGEAWRRQFRRKWGLEQLRALQKSFPADDNTLREPWDDALALVQAVNSSQARQVDMTLPLPAALAPEPAAMPLLDIEDSFADVLLENIAPTCNLAGGTAQLAGKATTCMEASLIAHSVALKAQELQFHQVKMMAKLKAHPPTGIQTVTWNPFWKNA